MMRRILDKPKLVQALWSTGTAVTILLIMKIWIRFAPEAARDWRIGEIGAISATGALLVGWSIVSQKSNVAWFLALRICACLVLTLLLGFYLLAGSDGIVLSHDLHIWLLPAGLVSLLIVLQSDLHEFAMPMSWRVITFIRGVLMIAVSGLLVYGLPWLLGQNPGDVPAAIIHLLPKDTSADRAGLHALGVILGAASVLFLVAVTGFRGSQHLVASILPPWSDCAASDAETKP